MAYGDSIDFTQNAFIHSNAILMMEHKMKFSKQIKLKYEQQICIHNPNTYSVISDGETLCFNIISM